jgi:hypothetical protein
MRLVKITTSTALFAALTFSPAYAAPNGPKAAKAPKAAQASKPAGGPKTTKAPKTVQTAKVDKARPVTAAKPAKADAKLTKLEKSAASNTSTTATGTTLTNGIDFAAGPIGEKLTRSTQLRSKLERQLVMAGYEGSVYQAAYGFRNLGQFVAAVNVSEKVGLSFEDLKLQMTGLSVDAEGTILKANLNPDGTITMVDPEEVTKPAPTLSLGQAIQELDDTVDATGTATTATTQAEAEIAATSTGNN